MNGESEENTLDFLRQRRNRKTVPERDTSLVKSTTPDFTKTPVVEENSSIDLASKEKINHGTDLVSVIEAELNTLPVIARRSNIRVDEAVLEKAEQDFKRAKITLETFFEAAYSLAEQDPELKQKIFEEARRRKKERDRAGQLRRDLARLTSY